MGKVSYTSFLTRMPSEPRGESRAQLDLIIPILTWNFSEADLERRLRSFGDEGRRESSPVVLVMLSSQPSFRPQLWQYLKTRNFKVVSVAEQFRDKVGTASFIQAVEVALAAQNRGFGVRKNTAQQEEKPTQEEAAVDDLSAEEEEELFEQLRAAHAR